MIKHQEKREKKIKRALVVEGGAMRGIFSTGIFDAFIREKFNPFDLCIGVSAGSTNIAAYLAGMFQRNYKVYTDYSLRPDFISLKKFLLGGHLVDLDWMWEITIREIRLDLKKIMKNRSEFSIGITDVKSGKTIYVTPDENTLEIIMKASSALPLLYRNFVKVNGFDYADGGISDPIPVREAYRRGAKEIVVVRSRPFSNKIEAGKDSLVSRFFLRKYPGLLKALLDRPRIYNESIEFLRNPPKEIKIIEINPPEDFRTKRLTKDISILKMDYDKGFLTGLDFVRKWESGKV